MDKQTGPKGFLVVLPGEIIEIPQDSDKSWLTLFYSLPRELAEKWKPAYELPRCPYEVLRTDKYDHIVCDDMVAGHLREKSGYYYAVLNYTDSLGKRKTKWISTGLTVKGNKKRAEAILMDARRNFNPEEPKVMNGDILFADYMEKWLDIIKSSVAVPTFASYSTTVKKIVAPYFREKDVTLKNLTAKDIQEFYLSELERVSPSSVIHYHANIHKALKYAVKIDLIDVNPADKVERPKKDRYVGSFYDADEVTLSTLMSGQTYYVCVDSFNENGITTGKIIKMEG